MNWKLYGAYLLILVGGGVTGYGIANPNLPLAVSLASLVMCGAGWVLMQKR
jgi:hypothetical protein